MARTMVASTSVMRLTCVVLATVSFRAEGLDNDEACKNFTYGNPQALEFYSPKFPQNYPKEIKCVRAITADYGYFVRIDFRDYFHIEPPPNEGECTGDYLEVRDGDQGYSPLIGKYCGFNFPPIITSSGRSLWLRFISDKSIEYNGFKGVYHYIPNPIGTLPYLPKCEFEVVGDQDFFGTENISQVHIDHAKKYKIPIDCTWNIRTSKDKVIYIQFKEDEEGFNMAMPNDCNFNYLQIFDQKTDEEHRRKHFCGSIAEMYQSATNISFVRFYADGDPGRESKFSAIFTSLREVKDKTKSGDVKCEEGEYDCEDATCIINGLKCNGVKNCKFGWDEESCATAGSAEFLDFSAPHVVIILILLIFIMAGMCSGMIYNLVRKLGEDKEDILASREKSLASLGLDNASDDGPSLPPTPAGKSRTSRATSNTDCNHCYVPNLGDGPGFPFGIKS